MNKIKQLKKAFKKQFKDEKKHPDKYDEPGDMPSLIAWEDWQAAKMEKFEKSKKMRTYKTQLRVEVTHRFREIYHEKTKELNSPHVFTMDEIINVLNETI